MLDIAADVAQQGTTLQEQEEFIRRNARELLQASLLGVAASDQLDDDDEEILLDEDAMDEDDEIVVPNTPLNEYILRDQPSQQQQQASVGGKRKAESTGFGAGFEPDRTFGFSTFGFGTQQYQQQSSDAGPANASAAAAASAESDDHPFEYDFQFEFDQAPKLVPKRPKLDVAEIASGFKSINDIWRQLGVSQGYFTLDEFPEHATVAEAEAFYKHHRRRVLTNNFIFAIRHGVLFFMTPREVLLREYVDPTYDSITEHGIGSLFLVSKGVAAAVRSTNPYWKFAHMIMRRQIARFFTIDQQMKIEQDIIPLRESEEDVKKREQIVAVDPTAFWYNMVMKHFARNVCRNCKRRSLCCVAKNVMMGSENSRNSQADACTDQFIYKATPCAQCGGHLCANCEGAYKFECPGITHDMTRRLLGINDQLSADDFVKLVASQSDCRVSQKEKSKLVSQGGFVDYMQEENYNRDYMSGFKGQICMSINQRVSPTFNPAFEVESLYGKHRLPYWTQHVCEDCHTKLRSTTESCANKTMVLKSKVLSDISVACIFPDPATRKGIITDKHIVPPAFGNHAPMYNDLPAPKQLHKSINKCKLALQQQPEVTVELQGCKNQLCRACADFLELLGRPCNCAHCDTFQPELVVASQNQAHHAVCIGDGARSATLMLEHYVRWNTVPGRERFTFKEVDDVSQLQKEYEEKTSLREAYQKRQQQQQKK